MWMLMFSINLAMTSLIKHIWSWTKSTGFFPRYFPICCEQTAFCVLAFCFQNWTWWCLWALFLSHGNHKKNQSIASHCGIYLKLNISMVNTRIKKWKNSSLSHKVQYAFTFSLQRETLYSHSVEERNPHITHLPKLLAKITSMKYL